MPIPSLSQGLAIVCAVLAAVALWYRAEWQDCQASVAIDAAKSQERVNAAQASDAAMTHQLETKLRPIVDQLQEQANATQRALAKVPSNPACARTPAADAFDRSVRPASRQGDPSPPRPAGP